MALHPDAHPGCAAIEGVLASGVVPSALEYLDRRALLASGASFFSRVPDASAFVVIAEADGSREETKRVRSELLEVLGENALQVHAPTNARP